MRNGLCGVAAVASLFASLGTSACSGTTQLWSRTAVMRAGSSATARPHVATAQLRIRPVGKHALNGQSMVWDKQTSPEMFEAGAELAGADVRQAPGVLVQLSTEDIQNIKAMSATDPEGAKRLIEEKLSPFEKAVKGTDCSKPDPLAGKDDPKLPLVACSQDGAEKLVLEPSVIDGGHVASVCARFSQQMGSWGLTMDFDPETQQSWSQYTVGHIGTQVAVAVESRVVSHPAIQGVINGSTQINGKFSEQQAKELADALGGCRA